MTALANSAVFWIGLIDGLAVLYVLPTIIAVARHAEGIALVIILNRMPIGWPAALILACMMPRKDDRPG